MTLNPLNPQAWYLLQTSTGEWTDGQSVVTQGEAAQIGLQASYCLETASERGLEFQAVPALWVPLQSDGSLVWGSARATPEELEDWDNFVPMPAAEMPCTAESAPKLSPKSAPTRKNPTTTKKQMATQPAPILNVEINSANWQVTATPAPRNKKGQIELQQRRLEVLKIYEQPVLPVHQRLSERAHWLNPKLNQHLAALRREAECEIARLTASKKR